MKIYESVGLTYDDVLVRPGYSELSSRQDANFMVTNSPLHEKPLAPIIVANMKTLATVEMAYALDELGIMVPSHRFQRTIDQEVFHITYTSTTTPEAASIGVKERERTEKLAEHIDVFFLELAHADNKYAIQEIKWLKATFPDKKLVVGNVATGDAAKRLFDAGADVVKVGIGPGAVCTTRLVTGCGVPQVSALIECAAEGPVIADGGIRNSGDIVKALVAGATFVMIGSLFAGTDETAGDKFNKKVMYYGMASREAGKVSDGNVPEGISHVVPYAGSAAGVARDLLAGVRQGMAMVGASTLEELREKAELQLVSVNSVIENQPHIRFRV